MVQRLELRCGHGRHAFDEQLKAVRAIESRIFRKFRREYRSEHSDLLRMERKVFGKVSTIDSIFER